MIFSPLVLASLILFLGIGLLAWFFNKRRKKNFPPLTYEQIPVLNQVTFCQVDQNYPINPLSSTYSMQGTTWKSQMLMHGQKLQKQGVHTLYFSHGTFAGDDPLDLARLMEDILPNSSPIIKSLTRKLKNAVLKDLGNIDDNYIELLEASLGGQINIINFTWNSANHHLARVLGCLDFMERLYRDAKKDNFLEINGSILLIGHSHAGQLFALLSQFISNRQRLIDLLKILSLPTEVPLQQLELLSQLKFEVVTLGTPARYQWQLPKSWRLLHIINHRGNDHLGGTIPGLLWTRDGDYIQQFGINGSDHPTLIAKDQLTNRNLDFLLGPGFDFKYWRNQIKHRRRLHNAGFHLLTDFNDQSLVPNFHKTILGHGNYTKYRHMEFLIRKIVELIYT